MTSIKKYKSSQQYKIGLIEQKYFQCCFMFYIGCQLNNIYNSKHWNKPFLYSITVVYKRKRKKKPAGQVLQSLCHPSDMVANSQNVPLEKLMKQILKSHMTKFQISV